MNSKVYEVRNAKGTKLGKITVVTTTKNTVCVVEWSNGGFMFFAGPAMILFKAAQRELIVEFNGTACVVGPCCKRLWHSLIDESAAYFAVLFDTGFRAMGDVLIDRRYITYLSSIDRHGTPTLGFDHGKVSWDRVIPYNSTFDAFEEYRLSRI